MPYCVSQSPRKKCYPIMEDSEAAVPQLTPEELGEELQDWAAFNKRFASLKLADEALPKRPAKDFDVDYTQYQSSALDEARDQMFLALGHVRGHHEKSLLEGVWVPSEGMAMIPHARGNFFRDIGTPHHFEKKPKLQGCWLSSIETVYLVERGSLILYLADSRFEDYLISADESFDFSTLHQVTLSHLYSLAFSNQPDMHDKYQVYALLKRLGYLVRPSRPILPQFLREERLSLPAYITIKLWDSFAYLGSWLRSSKSHRAISSSHFFNYTSMFEALQYVPTRSDSEPISISSTQHPNGLDFDVWRPTSTFSKKAPGNPDYTVCVVNIDQNSFPCYQEMLSLWQQLPESKKFMEIPKNASAKPKKESQLGKKGLRAQKAAERHSKMDKKSLARLEYHRLRDSKLKKGSSGRGIVIAAIDNGIINFSSLGETDFALSTPENNFDLESLKRGVNHGIVIQEETKI